MQSKVESRKGGAERSGQKSLELPASSIAWPNYIVGIWQINSPKLHTHSARNGERSGDLWGLGGSYLVCDQTIRTTPVCRREARRRDQLDSVHSSEFYVTHETIN